MKSIEHLILQLEATFDELPQGELKPDTPIETYLSWNSMTALMLIAMVKLEYNVDLTGDELMLCQTADQLQSVIASKTSSPQP